MANKMQGLLGDPLFQMGAGILANNTGHYGAFGPAVGGGIMAGMRQNNFNQEIQMRRELQKAQLAQVQQQKTTAERKRQRMLRRQEIANQLAVETNPSKVKLLEGQLVAASDNQMQAMSTLATVRRNRLLNTQTNQSMVDTQREQQRVEAQRKAQMGLLSAEETAENLQGTQIGRPDMDAFLQGKRNAMYATSNTPYTDKIAAESAQKKAAIEGQFSLAPGHTRFDASGNTIAQSLNTNKSLPNFMYRDESGQPQVYSAYADLKENEARLRGGGGTQGIIELGKKQAASMDESFNNSQKAKASIINLTNARERVNSGIVTGFGANIRNDFARLGTLMGVGGKDLQEKVANTQTFVSQMGMEVASIIKEFGAGTGLSDADREYAQKISGGDISLDKKAILNLLEIRRRVNVALINDHNKRASKVMSKPGASDILLHNMAVEIPSVPSQLTHRYVNGGKDDMWEASLPEPRSPEEFKALKSGDWFINTDGKPYEKP